MRAECFYLGGDIAKNVKRAGSERLAKTAVRSDRPMFFEQTLSETILCKAATIHSIVESVFTI